MANMTEKEAKEKGYTVVGRELANIISSGKILSIKNKWKKGTHGEVDLIFTDGRHIRVKVDHNETLLDRKDDLLYYRTTGATVNIYEVESEVKGWFIFKHNVEKETPLASDYIRFGKTVFPLVLSKIFDMFDL